MKRLRIQDMTAEASQEKLSTKPMHLSGLVKTDKGFAVATAEISPSGELVKLRVGPSQAFKEFVALEHKKVLLRLAGQV